eukprot:NODE_9772_length_566_cov_9.505643_g9134_i0.p1 GENE.NODE_9772_length_566_cov_9.505643_g9134_i0~~NODE_9772_length_566_cov_9.505643_g9134_i0.p1  ORF type:complete len:169 (-),score=27.45 NODE_9772_length_566_cov_9.505643_g9134_i0:35-541(-)
MSYQGLNFNFQSLPSPTFVSSPPTSPRLATTISTPRYVAPTYLTSVVQAPTFNAPTIAPTYVAPTYVAPTYVAPTYIQPTVITPRIQNIPASKSPTPAFSSLLSRTYSPLGIAVANQGRIWSNVANPYNYGHVETYGYGNYGYGYGQNGYGNVYGNGFGNGYGFQYIQ